MAIPQSQLETWSHQGAVATSASTYQSIKGVLESGTAAAKGSINVYLQGSYANDTNIRGDSDVDIVCELTSTFHSKTSSLDEAELARYERARIPGTYSFDQFRADVLSDLRSAYNTVEEGNKSLKVAASGGRLPADVVACTSHRRYSAFPEFGTPRYHEGIRFVTRQEGREIVNYPRQHRENTTAKHQATNSQFKTLVRIFKNARTYLIDRGVITSNMAPSYFVECWLFNVDNAVFRGSYETAFPVILDWLHSADDSKFETASGLHWLFGTSDVTWNRSDAAALRIALIKLWNDW